MTIEIDGRLITEYSVASSDSGFTATKTFDGFEIIGGGVTELVKGRFEFESGPKQGLNSTDRIVIYVSIESSLEGTIRLTQVILNIDNSIEFLNWLVGITGVSGTLSHDVAGGFGLSFNAAPGRIEFTEPGLEVARLEMLSGRYYTTYYPDAAAPAENVGRIDRDNLRDISFLDDSIQYGPIRRSQLILDLNLYQGTNLVIIDELVSFGLRENFWDRDGDVLAINVELVSIDDNDGTEDIDDFYPLDARCCTGARRWRRLLAIGVVDKYGCNDRCKWYCKSVAIRSASTLIKTLAQIDDGGVGAGSRRARTNLIDRLKFGRH